MKILTTREARLGILLSTLVAAVGCTLQGSASTASVGSTVADRARRGAYLVSVTGCNDCHTPLKMSPNGPEPDMTRMLSGHPEGFTIQAPPALGAGPWVWAGAATNTAFAGPWGINYAMNLTPDTNTGLGTWTEDMFVKALRTGKHMGVSRPIEPPMPWQALRTMSDEDLKSIYAYLRTLKPIANHVPAVQPPAVPAGAQ